MKSSFCVPELCLALILPPEMQEAEWPHPCCLLRAVPCVCSDEMRASLDEKHTKNQILKHTKPKCCDNCVLVLLHMLWPH